MGLGILSTGSYLPEHKMNNFDFEKIVDTTDEWIYTRTGVKARSIAKDMGTIEMGVNAAEKALTDADLKASDLGLIIATTITPDTIVPCLASCIQEKIGADCAAFDLNAACSGFLFGLNVALNMYAGKPILIISSEKLSRVVDYTDRRTCVLFGDGAAAVIVGESDNAKNIIKSNIYSMPDPERALLIKGINEKTPSYIEMDGKEVYKFATKSIVKYANEIIAQAGLQTEDISWVVPHQANNRIIESAANKLGIPFHLFFSNIENTGNTSSASLPIALDELIRTKSIKKGEYILLVAFGGGFSVSTAIVQC